MKKLLKAAAAQNKLLLVLVGLLIVVAVSWLLYALLAHMIMEAMYRSDLEIVNRVWAGRAVTRLVDYYYVADEMMLTGTIWLVIGTLSVILIVKDFRGVILGGVSLLCFSLIVFSILNAFPSLIKPLHLDIIPYYAYMHRFVPDDKLAFTERPFLKRQYGGFRGGSWSPLYGEGPSPRTIEVIMDENGFRNTLSTPSADIVVLGDSFTEHGDNESDTFGKRLQRQLGDLSVTNMGKGGYNPFQYLEVFKKYGISRKPKFAVICFYEGNDLQEMRRYLDWQKGVGNYNSAYRVASLPFFQRYRLAVSQTVGAVTDRAGILLRLATKRILKVQYIYPEIVDLQLKTRRHQTVFIDQMPAEPEKILMSEEGMQLRNVLSEFRQVAASNGTIPVLLYIPMTAHIYAKYSTKASGGNWLAVRDQQLALVSKANENNPVYSLSRELNIEFVDLVPVFDAEAAEGNMVYDLFDSHWSAEGREAAAKAVAGRLKAMSAANKGQSSLLRH